MQKLSVNLKRKYDIIIEDGIIDNIGIHIKKVYNNKKVFILTDERVKDIYLDRVVKALDGFVVNTVCIEGYEKAKSVLVYEEVCSKMIKQGIKRSHLIIALGGGVIGDLAGFIAATLYRGVDYVQIPTSLLAQMDSSIGGKTAINLPIGKNLLGAFHQPLLVLIDPLTLNTLPKKEITSGMGELIKHAFIGDASILNMLDGTINEDVIYKSLMVKKIVVEEDEFDTGKRMILNFGHTFGHAIEKKAGYGYYTHGEAVGLGMLMALNFGEQLGVTPKDIYFKLKSILDKYNFPKDILDINEYLELIKYDKKNIAGTINFILLKEIGEVVIHKIKEDDLCK